MTTILDSMAPLLPWHPEAARIIGGTKRNGFDMVVAPDGSADTVRACTGLYHKYVEPATGNRIPDAAFCSSFGDLPRWVFLEYLTRRCGVVLLGSNDPGLTRLEPIVLCPRCRNWNKPRYFAFSDSLRPMYQAIVDLDALKRMNLVEQAIVVRKGHAPNGPEPSQFYFGLDYRALPQAIWRRGTVYLYARQDLPVGFDEPEGPVDDGKESRLILPLAKLEVAPWDWPALAYLHGFDVDVHQEREFDHEGNFPWIGDTGVHPVRHARSRIEEVRVNLESNFAEKLSLESLGQRANVSAFALLRAFRAETGLSPHEYQTLLRLTRARHLLRRGGTIASVATDVGFYDQSHFHRYFRQIVGLTPGDYLRVN